MGFRVADPSRLRMAALVVTLIGVAWLTLGATRGAIVLLGLPILGLGVAGFDLVGHGRASLRQIALTVLIVAAGLAMWSFFVIVFSGVLEEGRASLVWYVLLPVSTVVAVGGLVVIRRPDLGAAVSNAVAAGRRARSRTRTSSRGRHAAPPPRPAFERPADLPRAGSM